MCRTIADRNFYEGMQFLAGSVMNESRSSRNSSLLSNLALAAGRNVDDVVRDLSEILFECRTALCLDTFHPSTHPLFQNPDGPSKPAITSSSILLFHRSLLALHITGMFV